MSYIYPKAEQLVGKDVEGTAQCVALIQAHTKAPNTSLWREGAAVRGNLTLPVGTAIATFVKGRYLSKPHGNHAAFYVGQDACGLYVVDQWKDPKKSTIGRRPLLFADHLRANEKKDSVDIGDNYSVIE